MAVTDIQSWADNLELVRLPAITSDISDLTAAQAIYTGELNAKSQEFSDRLDAHSVRINSAQASATTATTAANQALSTIYQTDLDAITYTNQKFQEAQNELNMRFDVLDAYLSGDYSAFVDTKINGEKTTFQQTVDAAVAQAIEARDSLNTNLNDIEVVNSDILNVHFPDVYQKIGAVENQAADFELDFNTAFAGFGYTSVAESLDALRESSISDISSLIHEDLKLPASLWTSNSTSLTTGLKPPALEENFTTLDVAFGNAYIFPVGVDETIGLSKPVRFDSNKIYKITVTFRVANEGTSGGVYGHLGVTTWAQDILAAQNIEKALTASPVSNSDGIVSYSAFFSDNLTKLQDLEFAIGSGATDEAVYIGSAGTPTKALFHFRQNPGLSSNGQTIVDTFQIEDVTEIFDAFSNVTGGVSTYYISVFQRNSSASPAKPSGGSYDFATSTFTNPAGWFLEIPAGTDPVFVSHALASAPGSSGIDENLAWSDAVLLVENGLNAKSVYAATIYRRASFTPSAPSGGSFDFGTNSLVPPSGWVSSVPSGTSPLYATQHIFSVVGDTGIDTAGTWTTPGKVAEDGSQGDKGDVGDTGDSGLSTYTGNVYRRASSKPSTPSGGSYNFGTNALTPPTGWYVGIPAEDGNPVWATSATTSTVGITGSSTFGTWASPEMLAKNGADGTNGAAGADAPLLRLEASNSVFRFDENGVSNGDVQIDVVASLFNTTGTINWSVIPTSVAFSTFGGDTLRITDDAFGTARNAHVTASVATPLGTVSDTFTINRIEDGLTGPDGESGYTITQSNQFHTFPADSDGNVADFNGSSTTFSAYYGGTALAFERYIAWAGEFSIDNIVNGPGVTGPTSDTQNLGGLVENITGLVNDTGYRDITICVKGDISTSRAYITHRQTFAKSKVGAEGAPGLDGARGPGVWHIVVTSLPTTSNAANDDFVFNSNTPSSPIVDDQAWFYEGSVTDPTAQSVWIFDGASWNNQARVIDGNLLVTGTVTSDAIRLDGVTLTGDGSGNLLIRSGGVDTGQLKTNAVTIPTSVIRTGSQNDAGRLIPPGQTIGLGATTVVREGGKARIQFDLRVFSSALTGEDVFIDYTIIGPSGTLRTIGSRIYRGPTGFALEILVAEDSERTGSSTYTLLVHNRSSNTSNILFEKVSTFILETKR